MGSSVGIAGWDAGLLCRGGLGTQDGTRRLWYPCLGAVEVRPGDSQVSSDPVEGARGQVTVAVSGDGRSSSVGWVHPDFVGPVGLALECASQEFELPAEFPVGHAATVRVPLGLRRGVISGGSVSPSSLRI